MSASDAEKRTTADCSQSLNAEQRRPWRNPIYLANAFFIPIASSFCTLHQVRQDREVRSCDGKLLCVLLRPSVKALDVWYHSARSASSAFKSGQTIPSPRPFHPKHLNESTNWTSLKRSGLNRIDGTEDAHETHEMNTCGKKMAEKILPQTAEAFPCHRSSTILL